MLQAATLDFLTQLSAHNNREWFEKNKASYEAAKADFEALVSKLLPALVPIEPMLKEQQAKDCIHRIYRDVRFSKDKSPYKTNMGAVFSKGGRKFEGAAYYLHIESGGKSFAGGGMWMPQPAVLKKLRQEIDYNTDEFKGIVEGKAFKKMFQAMHSGEPLKKVPAGYDADHPAAEYLKFKSFTVGHNLSDKDLCSKGIAAQIEKIYSTMAPFVDFLNRSMD
jgi:uncharacterized protein (TIGR02453 family)